jgi:hypothetical protein
MNKELYRAFEVVVLWGMLGLLVSHDWKLAVVTCCVCLHLSGIAEGLRELKVSQARMLTAVWTAVSGLLSIKRPEIKN